ncbi:MAG: hypothetical protein ACE3JP_05740 [Ectobacillus sp.]
MEYLFEAIAILFAVLFPLGCVVWFLKELISHLGDPSVITPVPEEEI